jgi:hypothetical protein
MQEATPTVEPRGEAAPHRWRHALMRLWPYLAMLVLAGIAVAWTDLNPAASLTMWRFTAVVYALIAVGRVWTSGGADRLRRSGVQLLHWGVFFALMLIIDLPYFSGVFNDNTKGLLLLILLGLATFLDGLYVDWRFCIVGLLLAMGAVLLAFLDQAAAAIVVACLAAMAVLLVIHSLVDRWRGRHPGTVQG